MIFYLVYDILICPLEVGLIVRKQKRQRPLSTKERADPLISVHIADDENIALAEALRLKSEAARALRAVPPGPLGTELFDSVAEKSISLPFEAAALRRGKNGQLYVYLRRRSRKDTAYPGQYHMPGKIKRPDEYWTDVMVRLSAEFNGCKLSNRRKVGEVPTNEARGSMTSYVFLVDLEGETNPRNWYRVDKMPKPLVDVHEEMFIPLAIAAFELEEAAAKLAELKRKFCDE